MHSHQTEPIASCKQEKMIHSVGSCILCLDLKGN